MGRAILLDRSAVARRLGLQPKSFDKLRERIRAEAAAGKAPVPFPEPVQTLAGVITDPAVVVDSQHARHPLWRRVDVDRYAKATGRRVVKD